MIECSSIREDQMEEIIRKEESGERREEREERQTRKENLISSSIDLLRVALAYAKGVSIFFFPFLLFFFFTFVFFFLSLRR